ncbi:MAG: hypothetical protein M3071_22645 [Actinomycetota bacterium]|nr:hypothetical protein [Actinomycetota bacterium]
MIVTWVALLAFSATPASAQCGETTNVSPRVAVGPGPPPLAVGDSVLYDAAQALAQYGFQINAMVCRTMAQGIVYLQSHSQNLPNLVVVALGTNGSVTVGQIDQLLALVGPNRVLAMVTPHHGNYAYVPGLIRSAALQHPGRILVLDWDQLSAGHPSWFAPDGIHLGSTAGVQAFARLVANALLATPAGPRSPSSVGPAPIQAPHTIQPSKPKPAQPTMGTRTARVMRLAAFTVEALGRWLAAV